MGMREEERLGQRQNKHDENWNARFKELLSYRSEHGGDCNVPQRQVKLGPWVASQRTAYKAGTLAQDRIDRLDSIGFKWEQKKASVGMREEDKLGQRQNKHDENWNARFKELLSYRSEHGDCDISCSQGKLGRWVSKQRERYRAGSLAQDRIERLNSIGFSWVMARGGSKVPWETRFHELVQYKAKHGDCDISTKKGKLGKWVDKQRAVYKAGSLAQDRIDRLEGIGFRWTLHGVKEEAWATRFHELVQYKAEHGDCCVSRKRKLGLWVDRQRVVYKAGSLAQDRIDRLSGIGFDWAPPRGSSRIDSKVVPWETRLNELVQYKLNHGDCDVPRSWGQLGIWVNAQRNKYKKDNLSQDRIDRLNGIGFDWTPPMGRPRKRKAPPSTRKKSLSRKERLPSPSTNVNSLSVGDGARGAEPGEERESSIPKIRSQSCDRERR